MFLGEVCPGLQVDTIQQWTGLYRTAGLIDLQVTDGPFEMMAPRGFLADEGLANALHIAARALSRASYLRKLGWLMPRMLRAVPYLGYVVIAATSQQPEPNRRLARSAMTRQPPVSATVPRHPLFARWYARLSQAMEQNVGDYRDELLAGLAGRVLEVGAGNGLNFAHYPATVTEVIAVEPELYLRGLAQTAAKEAPVPVEVVDGHAEALPVSDGSVDAAVASLVLCSVPDQARALAELARVIRPGGDLRFFEHVRAETRAMARTQRALDLVWPIVGGGCHAGRDTLAAITATGFQVTSLRRFRFPDSRLPSPTSPHILGAARRPTTPAQLEGRP